jgi:hypothetical protein
VTRDRAVNVTVTTVQPVIGIDQRTAATVVVRPQVTNVAGIGAQGRPGAAGGTSERRVAATVLGGHRIVRSTGGDTVGDASSMDPSHGDDTIGMTLGPATFGAPVEVQRSGAIEFNGWHFTPGEPVFLREDGMVSQEPSAAGFIQVVGHAESPTRLYLDIQPPIYYD